MEKEVEEESNKIKNYISHLMKKSRKGDEKDDSIVIPLTKQQLVDPNFSIAVTQNLFTKVVDGKRLLFDCVDKDLFFSEEEALTLLQNYELIRNQGGDLFFHETMYEAGTQSYTKDGNLITLKLGHRQSDLFFRVSFYEILGINQKLLLVAKKINEYSNKHNLSPYEKYLTCFNYIANIEYSINEFAPTHTYTGTIKQNKGCCVGKSQYLRILLRQCGINSCCTSIDVSKMALQLSLPTYEKYYVTLDLKDTKIHLLQELKNKTPHELQLSNNHCVTLIQIEDEKYHLQGIFASDVCNKFCGFMPIEDRQQFKNFFNFGTYFSLSHGCGFQDFIKSVKPQKLSDEEIKQIGKEFFSFTKKAIQVQFWSNFPNNLDPSVQSKLKNFISDVSACSSYKQIKYLFDEKRSEKTEFGKICGEIFEKTISDKLGILILTTQACENRAALEGCPLAKAMPVEKFASSKKIAETAYKEIFGKQDMQK